jgi:hypothetical protein
VDYDRDVLGIAYYNFKKNQGGRIDNLPEYMLWAFNRYDAQICQAVARAGRNPLDAFQRSVVAAMCTLLPGAPEEAATFAVRDYFLMHG